MNEWMSREAFDALRDTQSDLVVSLRRSSNKYVCEAANCLVEELTLVLTAEYKGPRDKLLGVLTDPVRVRESVVSSFECYRGVDGEDVHRFPIFDDDDEADTLESIEIGRSGDSDFYFYRVDGKPEMFCVCGTEDLSITFPDRPSEELFNELTCKLQDLSGWESRHPLMDISEPNKWFFSAEVVKFEY